MKLVPDRLAEYWENVEAGRNSAEDYMHEQDRLLGIYRHQWEEALLFNAETDLRTSLIREVATYFGTADTVDIDHRCNLAADLLKEEWETTIDFGQRSGIESFYESPSYIYDLMNWHSLRDDNGPLAYVLALTIGAQHNVQYCLDFGSGVGSGALLFRYSKIRTTLADISTTLLDFARWRFDRRGLDASFVDLKAEPLAQESFDMILAMDVFEHLADPVETVEQLWHALKTGGLLFARIHAEADPSHPQHIVEDFGPTFASMDKLGFVEIWRDSWLWGHQLFQKR